MRGLLKGTLYLFGGGLLVLALVIAAGLPSLSRAPADARESGAIGDARSVSSSQVAYAASNAGAFGRIECLGAPERCGFPAGTIPFLDSNIATLRVKQGYARSFLAGPLGAGTPDPGIRSFVYVAVPVTVAKGSRRGFAIDQSGRVCVTKDGTVPPMKNGMLAPDCPTLD